MLNAQPISDEIQAKWQVLPPALQQQVIDFIEFLINKYQLLRPTSVVMPQLPDEELELEPRILGLHRGMGTISDDFNDPLPDSFWSGESS
jgi:hypothetical protein